MKEKKMTKRDYFTQIKAKYNLTEDEIAFIDHELELLDRKNATPTGEKKLTATQMANEIIKDSILEEMEENRLYTISEMMKALPCCAELTNQKITRLVAQLVDANRVVRTEDKRKAYFSKA